MLDPRKAYTYFLNHFGVKQSTNGWHKLDCPHCDKARGKQKGAIRFDWSRFKCWECGQSEWLIDLVAWLEDMNIHQAFDLVHTYQATDIDLNFEDIHFDKTSTTKVTLPDGFKGITSDGVLGMRARKYLQGRGFDIDELEFKGFGYCAEHAEDEKESYFGYIIVPFKSRGELIYYQGRDFIGNAYRFKNPPTEKFGIGKADCIFNEDSLIMQDINFTVEGWADALTMGDMGNSTQGWHLSPRQMKLMINSTCSHQVFVPDIGIATDGISFYKKALQLALQFIDLKPTYVLDLTKLSGSGDKDVNDIGMMPVLDLFESSKPLTYSKIITELL
jgi:hypothetical protein|tara:strand:- start:72 stop:1064 length:993 start_codon:yes stop_codon:yes gene_type:complete